MPITILLVGIKSIVDAANPVGWRGRKTVSAARVTEPTLSHHMEEGCALEYEERGIPTVGKSASERKDPPWKGSMYS